MLQLHIYCVDHCSVTYNMHYPHMRRTVTVDVGNFEFMEIPQLDPGTTRVADVIQLCVNMHKKLLQSLMKTLQ